MKAWDSTANPALKRTGWTRWKRKIAQRFGRVWQPLFYAGLVLGFLLGRTVPEEQFAPFGIAFYAAVLGAGFGQVGSLGVAIAVLVGIYSTGAPLISVGYTGVALILCYTLSLVFRIGRKEGSLFAAASLAAVAVALPAMLILGRTNSIELLFWVCVSGALGLTFAMGILDSTRGRVLRAPDFGVPVILLVASAFSGLEGLRLGSNLSPHAMAGALLVMTCSLAGGPLLGSAGGAILGLSLLFSALARQSVPTLLVAQGMAYVLAGLLAGWFRVLGRFGVALAFGFSLLTVTAVISPAGPQITGTIVDMLVAGGLFLLIPSTWFTRLPSQLVVSRQTEVTRPVEPADTGQVIDRLKGMSRVLKEVNRTLDQVAAVAAPEATVNRFDQVTEQVCRSCSLFKQCWNADFNQTSRIFSDLWREMEERGPLSMQPAPENLAQICIYPDRVALTLNYMHDLHRSSDYWGRKLVEGRSLVGDYVKNITRMMDRFIDEYSTSEGKGRPESPPALRVVSGIARLPKRGGHISGDSFLSNALSPDRYLMVLSDGMGVGKLASVESKQCVNLVHQMIEAGFTPEVAVQTANSALLLRSPEDTFATVDVALCDLATGRAEFVKIGAAPSFMKRGTDVTLVKMSSVPIGIINQVQIEPEYRILRPGDLLIMITDGIWDVSKNASDKERWLINHLTRETATDPEEVAESILARAMELMPEVGDDMTVLVARFDPLIGGKAVAEAKRLEPTTWASVKRAPRPGGSQPSTRAK